MRNFISNALLVESRSRVGVLCSYVYAFKAQQNTLLFQHPFMIEPLRLHLFHFFFLADIYECVQTTGLLVALSASQALRGDRELCSLQ